MSKARIIDFIIENINNSYTGNPIDTDHLQHVLTYISDETYDDVDNDITYLNEKIDNISLGKFLTVWNCTTGKPTSEPKQGVPYIYSNGDFFIVGYVGDTNYKPNGNQYTGEPSTVVESNSVSIGDIYKYDGNTWMLLKLSSKEVTFSNISGSWSDNTSLSTKFAQVDANIANKQDKLRDDDESYGHRVHVLENEMSGVRVYDYVYPENGKILLPKVDGVIRIISLSSKKISDALYNVEINSSAKIDNNQIVNGSIILYQSGDLADINNEGKYFYDRADFLNRIVERHCLPVKVSDVGNISGSGVYSWDTSNDRLSINKNALKTKWPNIDINTTGFKIKTDCGLTCRVLSSTNICFEGFSTYGITTRDAALNYIKNSTGNVIFGRTTAEETFDSLNVTVKISETNGSKTEEKYITGFNGCAQLSYVSLTEVVYTKTQVDTKLATKQNVIPDIDTIRSNAEHGEIAYSWGTPETHGYLTLNSYISSGTVTRTLQEWINILNAVTEEKL